MKAALINSILLLFRAVIEGRVISKIEALVLMYVSLPRLQDEDRRAYNNRRKDLVVSEIQRIWPEYRTALIESVLSLIVMRVNPK